MRAIAFLLLCAMSPPPAHAASAGREPFNFLFLDADARSVAMGGAYTALATDGNAMLYNPAGLGGAEEHRASFMRTQYVAGISQDYLGVSLRQGAGFMLDHLSYGDIPRTTLSQPAGTGSDFGARDIAAAAGYGRAVLPGLRFGAAAKYIDETIDTVSGAGWAVDAGALYDVTRFPGLRLAAAVQNAGPPVTFESGRENLPLTARAGAEWTGDVLQQHSTLSLDVARERSEAPIFALGIETVFGKRLALRAGYTTRDAAGTGVTLGLGWMLGELDVSYAFVPMGDLGNAHRFSLAMRWGGAPPPPPPRELMFVSDSGGPQVSSADRFEKADLDIQRGDARAAQAELQAAVVLLPPSDGAWVRYYERLGDTFRLQQDFPTARAAYEKAIQRARDLRFRGNDVARAWLGAGLCRAAEGRKDEALKLIDKALLLQPSPDVRDTALKALSGLGG
ncbi:MAG: PorV/PorQ family protein [Elusimicrobia bacterium]|nr:PorV/PorQ family protein [Elusimicrobiota bacterium]